MCDNFGVLFSKVSDSTNHAYRNTHIHLQTVTHYKTQCIVVCLWSFTVYVIDKKHRPWSRQPTSRGLSVVPAGAVYVACDRDLHDRHRRVTTERPALTSLTQYLNHKSPHSTVCKAAEQFVQNSCFWWKLRPYNIISPNRTRRNSVHRRSLSGVYTIIYMYVGHVYDSVNTSLLRSRSFKVTERNLYQLKARMWLPISE